MVRKNPKRKLTWEGLKDAGMQIYELTDGLQDIPHRISARICKKLLNFEGILRFESKENYTVGEDGILEDRHHLFISDRRPDHINTPSKHADYESKYAHLLAETDWLGCLPKDITHAAKSCNNVPDEQRWSMAMNRLVFAKFHDEIHRLEKMMVQRQLRDDELMDDFRIGGEHIWKYGQTMLEENRGMRGTFRKPELTAPKPDLYFAFHLHTQSVSTDDEEMIKNFNSKNLQAIARRSLLQNTRTARFNPCHLSDYTARQPKSDKHRVVFPWLIGEWKHAQAKPKEVENVVLQAANGCAVALTMLAKLASPGGQIRKPHSIWPVFAITSVGSRVDLWVAHVSDVDDNGSLSFAMYRIWSGDLTKELHAVELLVFLDRLHQKATTELRRWVADRIQDQDDYSRDTIIAERFRAMTSLPRTESVSSNTTREQTPASASAALLEKGDPAVIDSSATLSEPVVWPHRSKSRGLDPDSSSQNDSASGGKEAIGHLSGDEEKSGCEDNSAADWNQATDYPSGDKADEDHSSYHPSSYEKDSSTESITILKEEGFSFKHAHSADAQYIDTTAEPSRTARSTGIAAAELSIRDGIKATEALVQGQTKQDTNKGVQLVYSDNDISPEEKLARLSRYAFDADNKIGQDDTRQISTDSGAIPARNYPHAAKSQARLRTIPLTPEKHRFHNQVHFVTMDERPLSSPDIFSPSVTLVDVDEHRTPISNHPIKPQQHDSTLSRTRVASDINTTNPDGMASGHGSKTSKSKPIPFGTGNESTYGASSTTSLGARIFDSEKSRLSTSDPFTTNTDSPRPLASSSKHLSDPGLGTSDRFVHNLEMDLPVCHSTHEKRSSQDTTAKGNTTTPPPMFLFSGRDSHSRHGDVSGDNSKHEATTTGCSVFSFTAPLIQPRKNKTGHLTNPSSPNSTKKVPSRAMQEKTPTRTSSPALQDDIHIENGRACAATTSKPVESSNRREIRAATTRLWQGRDDDDDDDDDNHHNSSAESSSQDGSSDADRDKILQHSLKKPRSPWRNHAAKTPEKRPSQTYFGPSTKDRGSPSNSVTLSPSITPVDPDEPRTPITGCSFYPRQTKDASSRALSASNIDTTSPRGKAIDHSLNTPSPKHSHLRLGTKSNHKNSRTAPGGRTSDSEESETSMFDPDDPAILRALGRNYRC